MSFLKGVFESYLGLGPASSGEGTAWRIEARGIGPDGWPAWVVVPLAVLAVVGLVVLYRREARRLPVAARVGMIALRIASLAVVSAMLTQATLAIDRTGLPLVAVLVDTSASMGLPAADAGGTTRRFDAAVELLGRNDAKLLRDLGRRFRVRLYRFDAVAAAVEGEDGTPAAAVARLREIGPTGGDTKPAAAARQVLEDLRGDAPSGLVVLTDGVTTAAEAEALSAAAPLAARRGVPIFPVGFGSDGPARDLELTEADADEVAFLGDPVRVTARFRAFGLKGRPVTVRLTDAKTGGLLAETTSVAGPDGRPVSVEATFTPAAEGEIEVAVEVRTDAAEADPDDNRLTRRVTVRKQKLRVLLADRLPRYEFRFLKSLLEREPTIDLDTVLQDADLGFAAEDRTALERFPLRKEDVLGYDVIVLGDLDPGLLGSDALAAVAEFVRVKGGGLIAVAGPTFLPTRYAGTPLEPLLPVAAGDVTVPAEGRPIVEPFRVRVTLSGRQSGPLFRLASGDAAAAWENLPPMYWRASAASLRPGAVALLEADTAGGPAPVVVLQRHGAGKTIFHLTDETWRWRFRTGDDAAFGRYWVQAIRYLARAALGRDGGAELTADRRRYAQGEPVILRARFRDERLVPPGTAAVRVVVEDRAGGRRTVTLSRSADLSDAFDGRIERLPEGAYHAWIAEPAPEGTPPAVDFAVDAAERELVRREADLADLRRAAAISGGRFLTPEEAVRLPALLPAGRPVRLEADVPRPLWNRPELLAALAVLLTGEWLLRKKHRLP